MEKKVYEGYKRTSTSVKSATAKPSINQQTVKSRNVSKAPTARLAGKSVVGKPRLAMFIDVDNAGISRENLLEILFFANGKYQIELCKLYGFSDDTLPGIRDFASEYNVVTVGKMKFKQPGVNCLDSRLLIDAYECALNNRNKIDMIFLWAYPCDLENLFEKIINLGVNTATIDNSIFDCKNKFVSQAFKLYSPYNFTVEQSTYGKVNNEPAKVTPSSDIESKPMNEEVISAEKESTADEKTTSTENNVTSEQPAMIDGVVPPVLPRRTIVERSSSHTTKPTTETDDNSGSEQTSSLVEEIARKLNLQVPTEEELAKEEAEIEKESQAKSNVFMEMLRQAGFSDLLDKKEVKYEDTIGDL